MNKKLFGTMAVATALLAGYNMYESSAEMKLSDLAIDNIEALAGCESPVEKKKGIAGTLTCHYLDGNSFTIPACDFHDLYTTICIGRRVLDY
ncbi:MAG: hypothetical protein IKJ42_10960 [Bacteroidaceae bacterium]|nr:hypothetical protein [Bacteroidaceae bacterium]